MPKKRRTDSNTELEPKKPRVEEPESGSETEEVIPRPKPPENLYDMRNRIKSWPVGQHPESDSGSETEEVEEGKEEAPPQHDKNNEEEQGSGSETKKVEEQEGVRVSGWDKKRGCTTLDPIEYLQKRNGLNTLIATYTSDSHGLTFLGYLSCSATHFCAYVLVHSESSAGWILMKRVDAYCRKEKIQPCGGYDFFNEVFKGKRTPELTYRNENVFGWDYAHNCDMNRLVTADEVKEDIKHVIESLVECTRENIKTIYDALA